MVITSKDNDLIKHIRKLKEKKYRDEFGEFVVEGAKMRKPFTKMPKLSKFLCAMIAKRKVL